MLRAKQLGKALSEIVVGIVNFNVGGWIEPVGEDRNADATRSVLAGKEPDGVKSPGLVTNATECLGWSFAAFCLGVAPFAGEFLSGGFERGLHGRLREVEDRSEHSVYGDMNQGWGTER